MDIELKGKQAVVCGSTQGIGKAIALELASMGATITLVARDEKKLRETLGSLPVQEGQRHEYLIADFNDPDDLKQKAEEHAAKSTVQILINNTGGPAAGKVIDASPEDFIRAFSAHLICNQVLAQAFLPGMKKARFGRIVNIISTSVKIPIPGLGVSNTIRGAVANWAKTLSVEVAPFGITVNNVLPGATMTARLREVVKLKAQKAGRSFDEIMADMVAEIPVGRIADPHEVAVAAAFLASPAAGFINGINLPVDGGRTGSL